MDVPKLAGELRVHLHEIQVARANVAGVERDVAEAEQVLGPVAAPSPYAEEGLCVAFGHVLDGDVYALCPGFLQRSRSPARERPPWGWRMDNGAGDPGADGQLGRAHEGLAGSEPPGAAVRGVWRARMGMPCLSAR